MSVPDRYMVPTRYPGTSDPSGLLAPTVSGIDQSGTWYQVPVHIKSTILATLLIPATGNLVPGTGTSTWYLVVGPGYVKFC